MIPAHLSSDARAVLGRAAAAFQSRFDRPPAWAGIAPGRINLIGEHTDYNDGPVLPMAIERHTVALAAPAPHRTTIRAHDLTEEAMIEPGEPLRPDPAAFGHWSSFVRGILALTPGEPRPLDILIASSVPLGSGLSSSAALEVALATLLEQARGIDLPGRVKAILAQRAEHDFAGIPCGMMDQTIAVSARRGHALLIDCRDGAQCHIPLPPSARARVIVLNTGIRHALASGEYARRRSACAAAAAALGLKSLRDAPPDASESPSLSVEQRRRVRHVTTEIARVHSMAAALQSGDLAAAGLLMAESHRSLRDDYGVSCPELDTLVEAAEGVPGVYGARMNGGGFGGCAIALANPDAVPFLQDRVRAAYRQRHRMACDLFPTEAATGAVGFALEA
jgi:galactokinase